jgi:hypothetical protein
MKLKDILKLYESTELNNYHELLHTLKNHCSKNLDFIIKNDLFLWRGMNVSDLSYAKKSSDKDIPYFIKPNYKSPRVSKTGSNLLISYVSTSPEWKDIPNRTKSTFTTNMLSNSGRFGKESIVIPYDNVKEFASCDKDFNEAKKQLYDLDDLIQYITYIFVDCEELENYHLIDFPISTSISFDGDYNLTLEQIEDVSDRLEKIRQYIFKNFDKIKDDLKKENNKYKYDQFNDINSYIKLNNKKLNTILNGKTLIEWLKENITPKSFNVKLSNFENLTLLDSHTKEIWFEGGYVAIVGKDIEVLKELQKDMK